jgi:opacity protein-like surface antigen
MKVISLLSVLAFTGSLVAPLAHAADMPLPAPIAPYDWSGFYVGAIVGPESAGATLDSHTIGGPGAFGGIEGSSRFQVGKIVFGADADITFSSAGSDHFKTDRASTVTGVFGTAHDNWLLYGKGGVAWANATYKSVQSSQICTTGFGFPGFSTTCAPPTFVPITNADSGFGWTAGIGIEWAFVPNWSVKLEYDHIDLVRGNSTDATHIEQLKAGLRWKFLSNPW